ncbi:hypothetical protein M231_06776 [Tremella mesenterica]|uniref:Uncharacterized protein n=2 Tax=Tremella mesenterica TaxID=5217 RepID=A0A4Q1BG58_TREME|nr:hypothetical protein M231_06776 [Tremella mesenterica]
MVLVAMGFAANPSLPYAVINMTSAGGLPLLSPPFIMLVIIAYAGYHILLRQEFIRSKTKPKSSSSSSSSSSRPPGGSSSSSGGSSKPPTTSADVRKGGAPPTSSSGRVGDPNPKLVSGGSGGDPRTNPSHKDFKQNYFLTMQGPGRPALVPFQAGLRPPPGSPEGTLWFNNVPDDAADLMAPPVDPDKVRSLTKNPWAGEMIEKEIELYKLKKRKIEEQERYEKVGNVLQSILGLMLCLVDMRLGLASIVFFLWRHFTGLHTQEGIDLEKELQKEKEALQKMMSEGKKSGSLSKNQLQDIQMKLSRL